MNAFKKKENNIKYAFKIEKKKKIFYPANILDFSLLWL